MTLLLVHLMCLLFFMVCFIMCACIFFDRNDKEQIIAGVLASFFLVFVGFFIFRSVDVCKEFDKKKLEVVEKK